MTGTTQNPLRAIIRALARNAWMASRLVETGRVERACARLREAGIVVTGY